MSQKVLVIGSGGREHALTWKLAQSPRVKKIFAVPGNGGTEKLAKNAAITPTDFKALIHFAERHSIDLIVVGPDEPLSLGVVDAFRAAGLRIWGPSKAAAQIEASKSFTKQLLVENHIPTARSETFSDYTAAREYVKTRPRPIVIKADGLALGKGVFICHSGEEAEQALEQIMIKRIFGDAGDKVIIEEFLQGQEISIHAFSDGASSLLLPPAQDHKHAFDGDNGPNTGGMGSVVPVPWVDEKLLNTIDFDIVKPLVSALAAQGAPFVGCLFPGLMITAEGPKVLECNARFGDPETQSYVRLLKTDLLDIIDACIDGKLNELTIEWHSGFASCVVLASGGYPGAYDKDFPISGIAEAEKMPGVVVFHAGTVFKNGQYSTAGGRVLGVTAVGESLQLALDRAYAAVERIKFQHMRYRTDIGAKALATQIPA